MNKSELPWGRFIYTTTAEFKRKLFLPETVKGRLFLSFLMMTSEDWNVELEAGTVTERGGT